MTYHKPVPKLLPRQRLVAVLVQTGEEVDEAQVPDPHELHEDRHRVVQTERVTLRPQTKLVVLHDDAVFHHDEALFSDILEVFDKGGIHTQVLDCKHIYLLYDKKDYKQPEVTRREYWVLT